MFNILNIDILENHKEKLSQILSRETKFIRFDFSFKTEIFELNILKLCELR